MRTVSSVLVIDDNSSALQTFSQLLRALGIADVWQALSAEDAWDILGLRAFDMILCDYRMDGMDGVEFVERLRARGDETPVIVLSGAPDKSGILRATQHRAVDFFPKPFGIDELAGAMDRLAAAA